MSLLFYILGLITALPGHPGPPVFVEIDANSSDVRVSISAEQESLVRWIGLRLPLPSPEFDPQIEERLAAGTAHLLKDERGLDLWLDGESVRYEIDRVVILEMFGAGNPEPALRVDLLAKTPSGSAPARIELNWGLFDRVEEIEKRVLPVLVEAGGEFDLLRATEAAPRVSWPRNGGSATAVNSELSGKVEEILVELGAPRWKPNDMLSRLLLGCGVIALMLVTIPYLRSKKRRIAAFSTLLLLAVTLGVGLGATRCAQGTQLMEEGAAIHLFEDLHRNVYRAFDARSESEIYDRLAACVHGSLLDELYTQILRGLVIEQDGGALCRVEALSDVYGSLIDPQLVPDNSASSASDGFAVDWNWLVRGRVVHFGHEHERTNRHRARYSVRPIDGAWRITSFEALEHERLEEQL